jgi:hypothetical protein
LWKTPYLYRSGAEREAYEKVNIIAKGTIAKSGEYILRKKIVPQIPGEL